MNKKNKENSKNRYNEYLNNFSFRDILINNKLMWPS